LTLTDVCITKDDFIFQFQFVDEELTFSDVTSLMDRDDLRRLSLKAGPELRIWKAINDWREQNKN